MHITCLALVPTHSFPISAGRGITGSRAPAAEAVPELQTRIFTKHFGTLPNPYTKIHSKSIQFPKKIPPPKPALQQLMPELPERCGTWSPGAKNSPNELPVFYSAPTGVFHQHRWLGHSLLPSSSTSRIEATWRFNLSMVNRLVSKNIVSTIWGPDVATTVAIVWSRPQ